MLKEKQTNQTKHNLRGRGKKQNKKNETQKTPQKNQNDEMSNFLALLKWESDKNIEDAVISVA